MANMASLSSSICGVTSESLDPQKNWYVLTKEICNRNPADFVRNDFFVEFPNEVVSISAGKLKATNNQLPFKNRLPSRPVYVVSTFGLCSGLLRQRDLSSIDLLHSSQFNSVITAVNGISLSEELLAPKNGANASHSSSISSNSPSTSPSMSTISPIRPSSDFQISFSSSDSSPSSQNIFNPLSCSTPTRISTSAPSINPSSESSFAQSDASESTESIKADLTIGSTTKKRRIRKQCRRVMADISDVSLKYHETLSSVLGNSFIFCCDDDKKPENEKDKYFVSSTISEVVDMIMDAVGEKKGLRELFLPETYDRLLKSMRVPDWVLLYFKLQTKLPDDAWQTLLNLTHLGRSGNSLDNAVLLTKNQIKAIKKMIFNIIKSTLKITELETDFPSCGVDLNSVLIWAIREQRLYGADTPHMEFNIKIDGRPLGGKDQIAVGIVPIDFAKKSPESALSVYPVAIANCKEERSNMKQLIGMLNKQKNWLKQHGLCVDGKSYNFKFTVTLDYKALLLLIHKKDDESFTLGGKGYGVEFCVFCDAVRACTHHGEIPNHACVDCLRSKANIARPTGVRDDLTFLLEEDLSNINLCSLHCEMRNMEQLLGSLGLFSHRVGTLDQLNNILSQYGPENTRRRTRIQVKEKPGQQTAVGRHNIKVASFSGCTERQFLDNAENIVTESLPTEKVADYFSECRDVSKSIVLNYITFTEERKQDIQKILSSEAFQRDFGKVQKEVQLEETPAFTKFLQDSLQHWAKEQEEVEATFVELSSQAKGKKSNGEPKKKKKRANQEDEDKIFAAYAAKLQIKLFLKIFTDWREIALTLRRTVYDVDDENDLQNIDIYEIKCREWGHHLRHLFGVHLGTGDYGHLTIDHSALLLREFGSLYKYSGQGFEASHKLHRQLFSKASNHDKTGSGHSLPQILTHWYANELLSLRYSFRNAKECIDTDKKCFKFRGCGWTTKNAPKLSPEDWPWVKMIDGLFDKMFGGDFLEYQYDSKTGTHVSSNIVDSLQKYDHGDWENMFVTSTTTTKSTTDSNVKPKQCTATPLVQSTTTTTTTKSTTDSNVKPKQCTATPIVQSTNTTTTTKSTTDSNVKPKQCTATPIVQSTSTTSCQQNQIHEANHQKQPSHSSQVKTKLATASTRREIAEIDAFLPPIDYTTAVVMKVQTVTQTGDLFSLKKRPCVAVLKRAEDLLAIEKKKGLVPNLGVHINGFGTFSEDDLESLIRLLRVSSTAAMVTEETIWLAQFNDVPSGELDRLKDVLWNKPPNEIILRLKGKSIDVLSFADIIAERHIDNFVVDICVQKFNEEGHSNVLYLPLEFYDWMKAKDTAFTKEKIRNCVLERKNLSEINIIIIPVHMPNHWGLAVIDIENGKMMFDDGLKVYPPANTLNCLKRALELMHETFPHWAALQSRFWVNCLAFDRFGMPSQLKCRNIGRGSCGIGIILAARDFISRGVSATNNIRWKYSLMNNLRLDLMTQIVKWSSST